MGQALLRVSAQRREAQIVSALVRSHSDFDNAPVSVDGLNAAAQLCYRSHLAKEISADVLIDFAGADAFDAALSLAVERGIAFVSGSTGLTPAQFSALDQAAETIPVLWAANFSLGIAVLSYLASRAGALLPAWDCEVIEAHHSRKLDAPSGTALVLGHAVEQARGVESSSPVVDRRGMRKPGEIGYAVVRGGDIVGEHELLFIGEGERVELSHRANNRDIFARGAITAALWMTGRRPGRYSIAEVLGLRADAIL
jgi:4-hydroxy-tetrahydrodipicolinate reductase